jgi:hypothetical protein
MNAFSTSATKAGCPTLATFLFLSLGWETTNLDQDLVHRRREHE